MSEKNNVCEEKLFESVYKENAENLHKLFYYKYGGTVNIEDHVQESFVKLWDNCKNVAPSDAVGYLYRVAQNLILNAIKRDKIKNKVYESATMKVIDTESPEYKVEEEEYSNAFKQALDSLTEEQRVAFMMCKVENMKHAEVAEILGISRKAVEKRLYKAINHLRDVIGDRKL
jgi:RNA polymerase sigma-70 factor (ECF subfamily)